MAGSGQRWASGRGVQGSLLLGGTAVQWAAFLSYMLPGMRDGTLDALVVLSPALLGLAGPFALHWFVVRHRVLGVATAAVLAACAASVAADSFASPQDHEALLWFVVVMGEALIVAVCAAAALIATGTSAVLRRGFSARGAPGTSR
jgi:hypothetical protein